jgi:hypothetical protein
VDADLDEIADADGQYVPNTNDPPLRPQKKISDVWPQLPLKDRLHVYVSIKETGECLIRLFAPPQDIERTLVPGLPDGSPLKRRRLDEDPDSRWLEELHLNLWNKKYREEQIFRKVVVTKAHYDELEKRLKAQHPDRDLPGYDGEQHDVQSIKLGVLRSYIPQVTQHPNNNVDQVDHGLEPGSEDVSDTDSLFPFTLDFLDLSTLDLKHMPQRLPDPLYIRNEYDDISNMIEDPSRPPTKYRSVILSGQPGTGEILQLRPYLTGSNQLVDIKARPRICT